MLAANMSNWSHLGKQRLTSARRVTSTALVVTARGHLAWKDEGHEADNSSADRVSPSRSHFDRQAEQILLDHLKT